MMRSGDKFVEFCCGVQLNWRICEGKVWHFKGEEQPPLRMKGCVRGRSGRLSRQDHLNSHESSRPAKRLRMI